MGLVSVDQRKRADIIVDKKATCSAKNKKTLVLIGSSTGGPQALFEIIPKMPGDVQASFLVVQHMPPGFTKKLANRLDQSSAILVKEAEDAEKVETGTAYIAPGGYHLQIHQKKKTGEIYVGLSSGEMVNGCRPSVDVLLYSAAKLEDYKLICVILTGMGRDGYQGIKLLKEKGAQIIAEDQTTAIVYGMPKVVIEANLSDYVVPLPLIAQQILWILSKE